VSDLDAVQVLREATHSLHETLDRQLPLSRPDATLADYALHLTVLRDWHRALLPWLSRTASDASSLDLMARDLADCTGSLPPLPLPDLTAVHAADDGSDAFCWGMAYVLEGSRLGGKVLYRRLQAPLSPHPLRYLGERNAQGPSWPQTLASLRTQLATPEARTSGCRGAVAAFELLLARFRRAGALA
jgi:heme oxygenase (biliverdin-IX-beta and delta-forming)